jgi:hypothetical protein
VAFTYSAIANDALHVVVLGIFINSSEAIVVVIVVVTLKKKIKDRSKLDQVRIVPLQQNMT